MPADTPMKPLFAVSTLAFWLLVLMLWGANLWMPPDRSGANGVAAEKSYTAAEIAKHDKPGDCWMLIAGSVYDLSAYLPQHPSAPSVMTPWCGREAPRMRAREHVDLRPERGEQGRSALPGAEVRRQHDHPASAGTRVLEMPCPPQLDRSRSGPVARDAQEVGESEGIVLERLTRTPAGITALAEQGREIARVGRSRARREREHRAGDPHAEPVGGARRKHPDDQVGGSVGDERQHPCGAAAGPSCAGTAPGLHGEGRGKRKWSGRLDLNQRPPAPHAGALPGCATPRP